METIYLIDKGYLNTAIPEIRKYYCGSIKVVTRGEYQHVVLPNTCIWKGIFKFFSTMEVESSNPMIKNSVIFQPTAAQNQQP